MFPKDFPDQLRSQILVSDIVGKKVKLKLRGKEFSGLCPFHNEKSPSFTVNDLKGFYHCFGCQAHGDIFTFVMKNEGLEFVDAVKHLADLYSIAVPQVKYDVQKIAQKQKEEDLEISITEKIAQFFVENLNSSDGREARNYLTRRGLNAQIIKKFRLGYAPNSYDALHKFLSAQNFSEDEMLRSGAFSRNDKNKIYDKFRHRVIFPITDKKNRVIAFGGRVLEAQALPKYLNSAETEDFKKSQILYNFFNARKPIFEKKYAVIVEGYMDVVSLVVSNIENVVAGLGTALSENHFKELFAITDKIVICLDGDAAGLRAAKRAADIALPLISSKKNVSFTFLPNQMDPDEFVKNFGAAKLTENFATAINMSQALLEFVLLDLNLNKKSTISAEEKAKIESELHKKIANINDATTKKYFSLFYKDALFLLGRKQSQKNPVQNFGGLVKNIYASTNNNLSDQFAKNIIALLIKFPQLSSHIDENFDIKEVCFLSDKLTEIKDFTLNLIENNPDFDSQKLLEPLENSEFAPYFGEIKNLLATIASLGVEYMESALPQASQKMSLLLLKELLLQVESQYKQSLSEISEIETLQTTISNDKIKELFAYKNTLEQKILELEKDF